MPEIRRKLRWTVMAACTAAMGFGATVALARPAEATTRSGLCPFQCSTYCKSQGAKGGVCYQDWCFCTY